MKRIHQITAYLFIALGVVHIGFANFTNFTERSLWFVGAGLAAIFGGFLNLVFARAGGDPMIRTLCYVANFLLVAFFIVGAILTPQAQAFCGLTLVAAMAAARASMAAMAAI